MNARTVAAAAVAGGVAGVLVTHGLSLSRVAGACMVLGLVVLAAAAAVVVTATRRERRVNERLAAEHEARLAHRRAGANRAVAGGPQLVGATRAPRRDAKRAHR